MKLLSRRQASSDSAAGLAGATIPIFGSRSRLLKMGPRSSKPNLHALKPRSTGGSRVTALDTATGRRASHRWRQTLSDVQHVQGARLRARLARVDAGRETLDRKIAFSRRIWRRIRP